MQLHAFLRSYQRHVRPLDRVLVLYHATTERHANAYAEVFGQFDFVLPVAQSISFREDVLALLPDNGRVIFFVDDLVFLHPWDARDEVPGLSLRLGFNISHNYNSHNYNSHDAPQPMPRFAQTTADRVTWRWAEGEMAWGYPISLDGHVFDLAQLRSWVDALAFHSPNTLESGLQGFSSRIEFGTCYPISRIVGVPWNKVQQDWHNRHAEVWGASVDHLLHAWECGMQIDLSVFRNALTESVHQEFPLRLEPRC